MYQSRSRKFLRLNDLIEKISGIANLETILAPSESTINAVYTNKWGPLNSFLQAADPLSTK